MAPKRAGDKLRKGRSAASSSRVAKKPAAAKPTKSTKTSKTSKPNKSNKPKTSNPPQPEDAEDELSAAALNPQRGRKRDANAEPDELPQGQSDAHRYIQLETKTRRIPQEQIDTWPHVSPEVLEQVVNVIRDAKKDIANTQRDERKVIAAHNALNPLVRRLIRQLSTARIPPQAKDVHFNVDKLTERNAHVFRDVTTARHSKQLLSEQSKVIQGFLKRDEDNLEQLKRDAKKWKAEWKHQAKHGRVHPLLQDTNSTTPTDDGPDDIGLRRAAPAAADSFDAADHALGPVLEQLRRSLENLQGNHAQVRGVEGAIVDAQAALDDVLFRHASAEQYAAV